MFVVVVVDIGFIVGLGIWPFYRLYVFCFSFFLFLSFLFICRLWELEEEVISSLFEQRVKEKKRKMSAVINVKTKVCKECKKKEI